MNKNKEGCDYSIVMKLICLNYDMVIGYAHDIKEAIRYTDEANSMPISIAGFSKATYQKI